MKALVKDQFFPWEIDYTPRGDLVLRGETHPGPGTALRHLSITGSDKWNNRGVYAFLSNAAHPTLHVIADTIQQQPGDQAGRFGYPDVQYHYRLARIAMIGLLSTWQLAAAYRDLNQEPSLSLMREIDDLPSP